MKKINITILNGPNLNMLGQREKSVYGELSLEAIISSVEEYANSDCFRQKFKSEIKIDNFQSNSEGILIDFIHKLKSDGLIFNPGAYTHTSIAIRDALLAVEIPFVEIHLSNIYKRESFRHKSYLRDIAVGLISGFGARGYNMALDGLINHIEKKI